MTTKTKQFKTNLKNNFKTNSVKNKILSLLMPKPTFTLAFMLVFVGFFSACTPKAYKPKIAITHTEIDADIIADPKIEAIIAPYKAKLSGSMTRIIGQAAKELPKIMRSNEFLLGNFVADLTLEQAKKEIREIDFAIVTMGGLRVSIPAGNISVSTIFELMPFENAVSVITVNGETMESLFEYMLTKKNVAISGVKMKIKNGKFSQIIINDKPFDKTKTYTIALSDYLAEGGDGMDFFKKSIKTEVIEQKYRDIIIKHIEELTAAGKKVDAEIDGRVSDEK